MENRLQAAVIWYFYSFFGAFINITRKSKEHIMSSKHIGGL